MSKYEGWTISEAIENGLAAMHKGKADVKITVLTTGKKGFLGIGKKQAAVNIELNPEITKNQAQPTDSVQEKVPSEQENKPKEDSLDKKKKMEEKDIIIHQLGYYLADITEKMGIETSITVDQGARYVVYSFNTEQEGALIGKHGRILNALQVLAQNYLTQRNFNKLKLTLDVGEYRRNRQRTLERLAQNIAQDVIMRKETVHLDVMPSFERKIIHASLAHNKHVKTYSRGREPHRYVIIEPVD
ncbi:RNA-binding cell elongation regulator Jag/EloR [Liquorilactobacillus capillatus]|uniref:RNA-binding protein KhpB n=1 Tax=Liquorilactobacillus capillatus DSM 19910 TaxID=1423731 RepID=A0A0R1M193_9LACO|nr:RNA-binding cell elongation regulator Jag/EloR [Liquorilactobacillus capillatus]KRL01664.1 rna-binding protein jag [Liquorilactobacillus capillatus DSM 19910]